jgi:hypothetical protein
VSEEQGKVMSQAAEADGLLQATCEAIVTEIAQAVDAEPGATRKALRVPGGPEVGWQIKIDATEKGGHMSICRMSILDVNSAPEAEAARIEYEHDKEGKFGVHRVYSVQSIRRRGDELILMENFLADSPATVREEDFRPISSEAYAQKTVLKCVSDWARYRAWQLQEERVKKV